MERWRGGSGGGSPAHAGMDPPSQAARAWTRRLPRTRGDGPTTNTSTSTFLPAPPHTRGWTRDLVAPSIWAAGSPAHAGMDPRSMRSRFLRVGLPRTRGDGPAGRVIGSHGGSAPPHTRGWTHGHSLRFISSMGSPAHAGMDPPQWGQGARLDGLPRTRGDGPHRGSLPRPGRLAPPHTRGWTSTPRSVARAVGGSPAHAGMDPLRAPRSRRRRRLPRTRGDGPPAVWSRILTLPAPPHTRGWTPSRPW